MKRILLVGEFSGLHKNLKEALIKMGHEVYIVSAGDGVKGIARDIDISVTGQTILEKVKSIRENKRVISELKSFDVVQFINPYIKPKTTLLSYNKLLKNNGKKFLLAAGDDVVFSEFIRNGGMEKYSPFDEELANHLKLPYENIMHRKVQNKIISKMDKIIPNAFEYAEAYRKSKYKHKVAPTIPFPMNVDKIKFVEMEFSGKIVIYHASNRPLFKGSKYITEALKIIGEKYPDEVEIINAEFLPLDEYLNVINRTHIVIDQCKSYSYAMNALYSLAKGKIVMSGSEEECIKELKLTSSPVINIIPNTLQIVEQIENLIKNRHYLAELSQSSRKFVEDHHHYMKVAELYLKEWFGTSDLVDKNETE
ncbi:hypothetical protein [Psychrobacillus sp. L3]|uniref:hypothetical protein n=1 Tax=Psychrobacillus sp. L3 TaxID=3236891 RepID=UPI0036F3B091